MVDSDPSTSSSTPSFDESVREPEALVDAFMLYNEGETAIDKIVEGLTTLGISTHFWRRDIAVGDRLQGVEEKRLATARSVLVLLGERGWGPIQLQLIDRAQALEKRILPVLIGEPPIDALDEAGGLFREYRHFDLRELNEATLAALADVIRRQEPTPSDEKFNRIVNILVDGNEEQRADVLRHIQEARSLDRPGLAARFRKEIQDNFNAKNETRFAASYRDPKKIPSIRSWLLSALIWSDGEHPASRDVILEHASKSLEPDRNVRFWTLAGTYQSEMPYLPEAVERCLSDSAPEVASLARAINTPEDPELIEELSTMLFAESFETAWRVLRVLRIVAIVALTDAVCEQLQRSAEGTRLAYDALYALSHPLMAQAAAERLAETPGVADVVTLIAEEARDSDSNAAKNFAVLLAAFDETVVERELAPANADPVNREIVSIMRTHVRDFRRRGRADMLHIAGYQSDAIDVAQDDLDIREDVQTLAAVMLAKEVVPPLAIGLFGDWGSGKSFFMKSILAATERLARRARDNADSKFCANIVSIEFNAWHYADTNLWASLVSYILDRLAAHVTPELSPEDQQAALIEELDSAKAIRSEAESEKKRTEEIVSKRQVTLQNLQIERQRKEMRLRDLKLTDLRSLLSENSELKQQLQESLQQIGAPAALSSVSELSQVVSEAQSLGGRVFALFVTLIRSENRLLLFGLLAALVVIPIGSTLLYKLFIANNLAVLSAWMTEFAVAVGGISVFVGRAIRQANAGFAKVEIAREQIDALMAQKRETPSPADDKLEKDIAKLKTDEQEAESLLTAATNRVIELERRIDALKEARSLARFLAERTQAEDYRKHLGLISTIRQDFDALVQRLTASPEDAGSDARPVDRIILYIDDLDRCPTTTVIDVLQAVHLLLAYPLFVVVVGVDPRWLLHSLEAAYVPFRAKADQAGVDPERWSTTPQNYLEKIFQIPLNLRPMSDIGYGRMVRRMFAAKMPAIDATVATTPAPTPSSRRDSQVTTIVDPGGSDSVSSKSSPGGGRPKNQREVPGMVGNDFVVHEEALVIGPAEAQFAERLFALIPTPRAAKRFSNLYRILKAPLRRENLTQFEGTAEMPGEFQVPMLLLAILISAPTEAAMLFPELHRQAEGGRSAKEGLANFGSLDSTSDSSLVLQEKVRHIVGDHQFPDAPELILEWLPRVSRFSFEVGRAMQLSAMSRQALK